MKIIITPNTFKKFSRQLIVATIVVVLGTASVNAQHRRVQSNKAVRSLPANHRTVHVGKTRYEYHGGIFYVHKPTGYHPVRAPIGARVVSLPLAAHTILLGGITYWIFNEAYYRKAPEGYVVVQRPVETVAPSETLDQRTNCDEVVVLADRLNVRSGPGQDFPVSGLVKRRTVLTVRGNAPGWLYVEMRDGSFGWVMRKFTTPRTSPAQG